VDDAELIVFELNFVMCRVYRDGVLSVGRCHKHAERERGNYCASQLEGHGSLLLSVRSYAG